MIPSPKQSEDLCYLLQSIPQVYSPYFQWQCYLPWRCKMENLSISENNGAITLTMVPNTKNKRKLVMLKNMAKDAQFETLGQYLSSLNGRRYRYLNIDRLKARGHDALADKPKNKYSDLFQSMLSTDKNHKPINSELDWIGVEIECCIPFESLGLYNSRECPRCFGEGIDDGEDCSRCGGEARVASSYSSNDGRKNLAKLFKENKITFASIKDDGSINPPDDSYLAVEVTILTRISSSENLRRACALLNRLGAKVNKSCGLHVHLDARHLDASQVKKIGQRFSRAMPVLQAMIPTSRRSNRYCAPRVSKLTGDRYYAVNLTAFKKYRTVEVRMHSSTTDFDKIINWARVLSSIASTDIKHTVTSINDLTDFVFIPENLVEYMTQRTALFSPESTCSAQYRDNDSSDDQLEIGA